MSTPNTNMLADELAITNSTSDTLRKKRKKLGGKTKLRRKNKLRRRKTPLRNGVRLNVAFYLT